jgi:hypothetical protein
MALIGQAGKLFLLSLAQRSAAQLKWKRALTFHETSESTNAEQTKCRLVAEMGLASATTGLDEGRSLARLGLVVIGRDNRPLNSPDISPSAAHQ